MAKLIAVDAPHFNCGVVIINDIVVDSAPILRWAKGWDLQRFETYCARKGWKIILVHGAD